MRLTIETELAKSLDVTLVRELLDAHAEAKRNFYLGGLRLSAVEGGRFCEAAFRILQFVTNSKGYTPLGRTLPSTDKLILELSNADGSKFNDSVRLHIPRSLRLVYDIRNKRDAAHLADGIDPNVQDATLVISVIDWVLAEFIRLYHSVTPDEATQIVSVIVQRSAPVIQDFSGFLKVLNSKLQASDHCLALLYQRGQAGALFDELRAWVRPKMKLNLKRTLYALVNTRDFAHFDGRRYYITRAGELYVEERGLINPA